MPRMNDHGYMSLCAELASLKSISLAAARRQIEIVAAKEAVKDPLGKKNIAQRLIQQIQSNAKDKSIHPSHAQQLDKLLEALAEEENFMIED